MKKMTLITTFFVLIFTSSTQEGFAAIVKSGTYSAVVQPQEKEPKALSAKLLKKEKKEEKKLERKKDRLHKLLKKLLAEDAPQYSARQYLILCLILFLASVLFFALPGPIFSAFGSVTAVAAAVFFVLWLLEYTGTM
jgi:Flp pilus assembly protein TadB